MKKLMLLVLGILMISLVGVGVLADDDYREGVIIITAEDNVSVEELNDLVASYNLTWEEGSPITTYGPLRGYVEVSEGEEQSWIDIFENEIIIKSASLSPIAQLACDSDNLDLCLDETNCTDAGGFWYDGACNEEEEEDEDNETGKGKQGLGQIIRGRVKAGVYTSPTGEQIRVRELAQNRFLLQINNVSVDCECELEEETESNKTKLKAKLSNGRKAEIKIMPSVASERALERLRLRVCSAENNCTIELKEVGSGNKTQLAYELQAERHAKLLWMFRKKMQVKAQVNAETGEIIRVKKPWWAFLASESEE